MISERQKSDLDEKRIAKQLGGTRVSGSGSSREKKEDISFPGVLMQRKRGGGKSISITQEDCEKVETHALNAGKIPAFSFGFGDGIMPSRHDWIAFPLWWLKDQEWWHKFSH